MASSTPIGTPSGFDFSNLTKAIPNLLEQMGKANGSLGRLAAVSGGTGKSATPAQLVIEFTGDIVNRVHSGARESVGYTFAKEVSGNPGGFTNDQLQEKVAAISKTSGITQARGAEAIAALIATGKVLDGRALDLAVVATAERNRILAVPPSDTAAKFAMLGREPAKGSLELDKSDEFSNYLRPEVLRKIVSLDDQGKKLEAVALAQITFGEEAILRARKMAAGKTGLDRFDQTISDVGDAVDNFFRQFGRPKTKQDQIDEKSKVIDHYRGQQNSRGGSLYEAPNQLMAKLIADKAKLEASQRRDLEAAALQKNDASASKAENAAIEKALDDRNRDRETQDLATALSKHWGANSVARLPAPSAVNQSSPGPRKPSSAGIQRAEADGMRPCIEVVCGCKTGVTDQARKGVQKAAPSEASELASVDPEQARQAALLESMRKATSGVLDQTTALDAQNTAHGKTKSALKELNIAQLERQYQDLDNTEQVIPGYLEALGARIEAEKELLKITRNSEGIEAADKEKSKRDAKATKMSDDIGGAFREGFVNLLEGKENALDKMGESLKKKIVSSIADALYDTSLKPAVEAFSGWFSGLFKGGSSGGGALGGESSGSNWLGSLVNGVMKFFVTSANGNVFASPGLHTYANSVVGKPTFFPFANGIGLMGEAGPEAIMPLRRGSDGRLGVSAQGASGGGALHYAPSTVFHIDSRSDRGAVMADLDRALQANNQGQMEQLKRMRVVPQ